MVRVIYSLPETRTAGAVMSPGVATIGQIVTIVGGRRRYGRNSLESKLASKPNVLPSIYNLFHFKPTLLTETNASESYTYKKQTNTGALLSFLCIFLIFRYLRLTVLVVYVRN